MPQIELPTKGKQDTIATTLGNPNPITSDKTSVMNFLNKIHDTQLPKGGLKPIVVTGVMSSAGTSTPLNITGSGFLRKSAFMTASTGGENISMKITIDDVLAFTFTRSMSGGFSEAMGILQTAESTDTSTSAPRSYASIANYSQRTAGVISYTFGTPVNADGACILLEGDKIPFNNNIKVVLTSSKAVQLLYELVAEVY